MMRCYLEMDNTDWWGEEGDGVFGYFYSCPPPLSLQINIIHRNVNLKCVSKFEILAKYY